MRFDRRHYPRRPARWRVGISFDSGTELGATSIDVSPDGMHLSLDRSALLRLCPRGHLISRADELDLRLSLRGADSADDAPIEVDARVINVRRLSQFEYRMGVQFLEFVTDTDERRFKHLFESGDLGPDNNRGPGNDSFEHDRKSG